MAVLLRGLLASQPLRWRSCIAALARRGDCYPGLETLAPKPLANKEVFMRRYLAAFLLVLSAASLGVVAIPPYPPP